MWRYQQLICRTGQLGIELISMSHSIQHSALYRPQGPRLLIPTGILGIPKTEWNSDLFLGNPLRPTARNYMIGRPATIRNFGVRTYVIGIFKDIPNFSSDLPTVVDRPARAQPAHLQDNYWRGSPPPRYTAGPIARGQWEDELTSNRSNLMVTKA